MDYRVRNGAGRRAAGPDWPRRTAEILTEERGKDGFGYDPLFYIRELGQASAELGAEEKNRRSHRGQALARLVERLQAQR